MDSIRFATFFDFEYYNASTFFRPPFIVFFVRKFSLRSPDSRRLMRFPRLVFGCVTPNFFVVSVVESVVVEKRGGGDSGIKLVSFFLSTPSTIRLLTSIRTLGSW